MSSAGSMHCVSGQRIKKSLCYRSADLFQRSQKAIFSDGLFVNPYEIAFSTFAATVLAGYRLVRHRSAPVSFTHAAAARNSGGGGRQDWALARLRGADVLVGAASGERTGAALA